MNNKKEKQVKEDKKNGNNNLQITAIICKQIPGVGVIPATVEAKETSVKRMKRETLKNLTLNLVWGPLC